MVSKNIVEKVVEDLEKKGEIRQGLAKENVVKHGLVFAKVVRK